MTRSVENSKLHLKEVIVMVMETINSRFKATTPIFTEEILDACKNYSKQYVFRMIKKAEENGEIICFDRGIYYIPSKTFFGHSTISSDQVAEKKYLKNNNDTFGIYCGLSLLNIFGITTQMPNQIEIVTNNETTRKREIQISNKTYIIRKSRCVISKDNSAAYTILQLFNDIEDTDVIDESSLAKILYFIKKNNVTTKQLISLADYFPGKTVKRMMRSPLLLRLVKSS